MAIRTVKERFFGEEEKEQIKSYSEKISKIFKIEGYDPECDGFESFFDLDDFDFIPCIKEAIENADDDEDFEDVMLCLDEAYNPSVKVSLEDLKKYAEKQNETLVETLSGLSNKIVEDFIEFIITTCDDETKQKFINWIMN